MTFLSWVFMDLSVWIMVAQGQWKSRCVNMRSEAYSLLKALMHSFNRKPLGLDIQQNFFDSNSQLKLRGKVALKLSSVALKCSYLSWFDHKNSIRNHGYILYYTNYDQPQSSAVYNPLFSLRRTVRRSTWWAFEVQQQENKVSVC